MSNEIVIHWFRQDLRLADNLSLSEAAQQGLVLPIYIYDDVNSNDYDLGDASKWWLYHSLIKLNESLKNHLLIFKGDPKTILLDLIEKYDVKAVHWNRCYEPWRIARDELIKKSLKEHNITTKSFNGSLLCEPWNNLKADGTPYKVFTPFYKNACIKATPPNPPLPKPFRIKYASGDSKITLDDLNFISKNKWHEKLNWKVGEENAHKRLLNFVENGLTNYKKGRDFPSLDNVSKLSPHLHIGELSPSQVWYAAKTVQESDSQEHFLRELGWREFSYNLLYHFPSLPKSNLQAKFDTFPWLKNQKRLSAWQRGQTGYPLVDAGMRQLWQTGYMHNRVRMVVGSFLVKNLLIHWHEGERWFWNTLLDADLANNSASWQWIAGCGADAAPYFRVFNPCIQGQKFDPEGEYTRKYVPELASLSSKYLFSPWEAPKDVLDEAGVVLGKSYPKPIVEMQQSRNRALEAYKKIQSIS
ncbi:MAG: deoxyribodipyrimidine photo-lyase [Pseudomonadota bacterium]